MTWVSLYFPQKPIFSDLPIYHLIRWISIVLEHGYTMLYGRLYLDDTINHILFQYLVTRVSNNHHSEVLGIIPDYSFTLSWDKQRVLMHGHQGWNVRHGLCHIYMIYVYIWVVHSFCLFCCLFIIVTTQFVALYEPCKPKPKPKPSTYDTRTTTPWQRSKFQYLDRSQSNKYAINMQIQTISVSK